jgi:hypothetical protein
MDMLHELYPVVQLIADTEVHAGQNSCTRIFVAELEEAKDLGTNPQADVRSHRVWEQRVEIDLTVSERAFVRLAYAYFPSLCVRVNGVEVEPMQSTGGFLVLPLSAGENRIEIEARLSDLRRILLGLDILIVLAVAWLWRGERKSPATTRKAS